MDFLLGVVYFVFDAAAALLLVATWQRTRITGFLVLASSYVLGALARWIMPLLYRGLGGDGGLTVLIQSLWLLIAAVALYGLWDIYRQLKRPAHAAPTTD